MNMLRQTMMEKDEESRQRLSMLDAKLLELETLKSLPGKCFTINLNYINLSIIFW